jgi:hypothetical protein
MRIDAVIRCIRGTLKTSTTTHSVSKVCAFRLLAVYIYLLPEWRSSCHTGACRYLAVSVPFFALITMP